MSPSIATRPLSAFALGLVLAAALFPAAVKAGSIYSPEPARKESRWKKVWAWSAAALVAASTADAATSVGRYELNPVLSGPNHQFGMRGTAIKMSVAGAMVGAQYWLLKKKPEQAPYAAVANLAAASLLTGVTVRNARLR